MSDYRILIADDHPVVRQGLSALLSALPQVTVVGEVSSGDEAVAAAARSDVDVILMDLEMPGIDGVEATRRIKQERGSDVRVVVLTAHDDRHSIVEAIAAGASGYLSKAASLDEIERALVAVSQGAVYVAPDIAGRALRAMSSNGSDRHDLTQREVEIVRLLCEGLTARAIASRLRISERTVNTHVGNLYRHLGVNNRIDAMREAMRRGLVDVPN